MVVRWNFSRLFAENMLYPGYQTAKPYESALIYDTCRVPDAPASPWYFAE